MIQIEKNSQHNGEKNGGKMRKIEGRQRDHRFLDDLQRQGHCWGCANGIMRRYQWGGLFTQLLFVDNAAHVELCHITHTNTHINTHPPYMKTRVPMITQQIEEEEEEEYSLVCCKSMMPLTGIRSEAASGYPFFTETLQVIN